MFPALYMYAIDESSYSFPSWSTCLLKIDRTAPFCHSLYTQCVFAYLCQCTWLSLAFTTDIFIYAVPTGSQGEFTVEMSELTRLYAPLERDRFTLIIFASHRSSFAGGLHLVIVCSATATLLQSYIDSLPRRNKLPIKSKLITLFALVCNWQVQANWGNAMKLWFSVFWCGRIGGKLFLITVTTQFIFIHIYIPIYIYYIYIYYHIYYHI